ncbi:MAG: InlB B-repeat-containing protein, partial [Bacilli bacterium]|nr:InlB B-repeat-containing protein [Bacilli bacterium]
MNNLRKFKCELYILFVIISFLIFDGTAWAAASWTTLSTETVASFTVTGGTQGATISDDGKHIFVFNVGTSDNTPILKVFTRQSNGKYTNTSNIRVTTTCHHCNDAAYYKSGSKEYIYVPQYDTTTKYFYRYELSSDYKSITATKKYELSGKRGTIAYNKDDNLFYTLVGYSNGGTNSKRLISSSSPSFSSSTNVRYYGDKKTSATSNTGVQGALYSYQGISYHNKHVYIILSIGSGEFCTDPAAGYGFSSSTLCASSRYDKELITVINSDTGDFSKFLYYDGDDELEVIFFDEAGNAYLSTINAGNGVIRKVSNSNLYSYNKLYAEYHMNGGTLASDHGSTYTAKNDIIYKSDNSAIKVGEAGGYIGDNGLADYNNSGGINITKPGYMAKAGAEWNTKANGTGTSYSQATKYKVSDFANVSEGNKMVSLYVNWVPATYTITYNANGGSGAPSATTYTYATSGTVNLSTTVPTRADYTFLGWSTSSTATSATYSAGGAYNKNVASNVTLYAVWRVNGATYTINYNANGGSGAPSATSYIYSTSGTVNLSTTVPTRTGYTFLGWSTSSTATSATYSAGGAYSKNIAGNVTLYAVWKANTYTITYNANGG